MMRRKIHARPRFWLLLSLTAALVFSVSLLVTHSRLDAASAQVSALTEQRDQLVREIGELQEEIDFVQTDAYVERAARDELGLIMPGEVRYVNGRFVDMQRQGPPGNSVGRLFASLTDCCTPRPLPARAIRWRRPRRARRRRCGQTSCPSSRRASA